jgi:hypothetical protein
MAHFSSKPCNKANAQCCCSGWITANSCDVSWEAINAINAQVRYGGEIQSTSLKGSIRPVNKEGVWQLWIQCAADGPMFLAAETEVDGSCEWGPGPGCCEKITDAGFIGAILTVEASPAPWSLGNGTYGLLFADGCSLNPYTPNGGTTASGVIDRTHPKVDIPWSIGHFATWLNFSACVFNGNLGVSIGATVITGIRVPTGNYLGGGGGTCHPTDELIRLSGRREVDIGEFFTNHTKGSVTWQSNGNFPEKLEGWCPDYDTTFAEKPDLSSLKVTFELYQE